MLESIVALLIIFWILGIITAVTMGGFIHILFIIALVMILLRVIRGPRFQRP
ncbi:MAG: lmo0937 family membrane protein [Planctomycetota bacterium]